MSEEAKEKEELATTRLLDLLRAQQTGKKVEKQQAAVPAEEVTEKVDSTESEEGISQGEDEPTAQSISDGFDSVQEGTKTAKEKEETAKSIETKVPDVTVEKTKVDSQNKVVSKSLLQEIQTPTLSSEPEKQIEIQPEEFDNSLFSTLSEVKSRPGFHQYISTLFHIFDESHRKLTLHCGDQFLRFLQVKIGFKKPEIEQFGEYSLPYNADGDTITEMDKLLAYVLDKELAYKRKKSIYGACFAAKAETKTHIFQTPKLDRKELMDLIEWNAKKNLPFSTEEAIINWEVNPAVGSANNNVVVGISKKDSVENLITIFKDNNFDLRLFSTLPVLIWKLFIRNYPDRKDGCYVLIHIGEKQTTITVVVVQKLLYTREIAVGASDFYKAVMQKVVVGDQSIEIDYKMAKQLLRDYGIPRETSGVVPGSQISLYKISIFLRPLVERMTGELNRSLNYFKKQNPDLKWDELLFDGIGATFPNMLDTFANNLNLKVGLLNPIRRERYSYKNGQVLSDRMLPNYTVNFALASEETEKINVITKKQRSNFQYIFLHKVAAVAVALCLPLFIILMIFSNQKIERLDRIIDEREKQWSSLSTQAKEYLNTLGDIEVLSGFRTFLGNDKIHSMNQIKILKLLSSVAPSDIKLTALKVKKGIAGDKKTETEDKPQEFIDLMEVNGFIEADASVSDIQLTNFVMKLEQLSVFTDIDMSINERSNPQDRKLFFTLNLRF
ncbi:MAG: pilus assembly protein PilM [Candidatus Marinimicrobia bacterium]|nr:pilus assembly protein PilM [Candidatus Neomarinimicrobiota bacterium]MBL7046653.1 pilus assembly protein PilM [Candidatus Neomarinimicrobiota bacterium]